MTSICFLTDGYVHTVVEDVIRELVRRGHRVESRVADETPQSIDDLRVEHDLYVLRSSSAMTEQLAALLAARGARTLNDIAAIQRIRNNVWTDKFLRDRGIPIPDSYLGAGEELAQVLEERGPLVIKPIGGRGVRVVTEREELMKATRVDAVYAQELMIGDGLDRRIHVIGSDVWASQKTSAAPVRVTPEMRDVARRIGEILRLEVYGVDVVEAVDGMWVVGVNGFPTFKGLPGVEPALADYIDRKARAA